MMKTRVSFDEKLISLCQGFVAINIPTPLYVNSKTIAITLTDVLHDVHHTFPAHLLVHKTPPTIRPTLIPQPSTCITWPDHVTGSRDQTQYHVTRLSTHPKYEVLADISPTGVSEEVSPEMVDVLIVTVYCLCLGPVRLDQPNVWHRTFQHPDGMKIC